MNRRGSNPLWYVLALLVTCAFAWGYYHACDLPGRFEEREERERELQRIRQEAEALEAQVQQAQERVYNLDADPLEVEASLRRIKGMVREDERIYRMEPLPEPGAPEQTPTP